jgi:hypothetical protein
MVIAGFEWGWNTFVAIGTIALALGTFVLALSTRAAARASAEDVRAQWRPVLVPGPHANVEFDEDSMVMVIRNVGRGAAYYVDAALGVDGMYTPADPSSLARGQVQSLAVLATAAELRLYFALPDFELPSEGEILIDYADLNGRPYSTRIQLDDINVASTLRVSKVELSDNRERIPWKPWTWEPATRREWLMSKVRQPKRE